MSVSNKPESTYFTEEYTFKPHILEKETLLMSTEETRSVVAEDGARSSPIAVAAAVLDLFLHFCYSLVVLPAYS